MHLPSRFTASSRLLLIDEPKPDSSLHTLWLILTCSATFMSAPNRIHREQVE